MSRRIANEVRRNSLMDTGDGITFSKKMVSKPLDGVAAHNSGIRPSDVSLHNRPDLRHRRGGRREELPFLDKPPHNWGTHDVNYQMISEEYRRGLRITYRKSSVRNHLGFIIDEC